MQKQRNVQIQQIKEKKPFYVELFSGWAAGCGRILTGQPFDIVKTRLQTQSTSNPVYSGAGDCFKRILKYEGISAFYKGTSSPLAVVGVVSALHFKTFEQIKKLLNVRKNFSKFFFRKNLTSILTHTPLTRCLELLPALPAVS